MGPRRSSKEHTSSKRVCIGIDVIVVTARLGEIGGGSWDIGSTPCEWVCIKGWGRCADRTACVVQDMLHNVSSVSCWQAIPLNEPELVNYKAKQNFCGCLKLQQVQNSQQSWDTNATKPTCKLWLMIRVYVCNI